jgi:hypothetical protein
MSSSKNNPSTVIQITNQGMGNGDIELQHKLIGTYLRLLYENDWLPAAICFYTCLLYTSPSPRDRQKSRMPSSA